ncbi:MAG: peptidylprolyl isomerase [Thiobacillus sp.]|nr:peptidylprolyl isomerase [Thiobacillus sp.]
MQKFLAAALCLLLSVPAMAADPVVAPGTEVRIDYTALADNRVIDSTAEGGPVSFVVGAGTMMPGLEVALLGMAAGEEKTFEVAARDAYGEADPGAVKRVPLSILPPDLKPQPGMELEVRAGGGDLMKAVVKAVEGDRVVLDFNHPLAGKSLTFKVKLLSVGATKAAEAPYPHAVPAARTWPELLKITAAGVVYPSKTRKRTDPEEVAALFSQIGKDADNALLQCGMQIVGIEVRGDILKTYSVLSTPSRATLRTLVEPSSGKVSEDRVLAALLAPYAASEERNRRRLACGLLLAPLAVGTKALNAQLDKEVCPRIERLTACLDDLRAADARVEGEAGPDARRLYSGERWDSKVDYLDQLAAGSR